MPSPGIRVVILAAFLPFVACQCDDSPLIRVAPLIEIDVSAIDFGEVPIGATKRIYLDVRNAGTADLTIMDARTTVPFGAEPIERTILAGASGRIDVSFLATNNEAQTGELAIESNDERSPLMMVRLSGQGVAGFLTVQPSSLDFGETTVGVVRSSELLFNNFGLEAIEGRVVAEHFDRPEHFSMTGLPDFTSFGRFSVDPRAELILDAEYRPLALGMDAGRVVFEVCGERCGVEVGVSGIGSEAAVRLVPGVLDYQTIGIGDTKTKQLVVENLGNSPLEVLSAVGVSSSELNVSSTKTLPYVLAAGESLGLNVELTARGAGDITGSVVVKTTDPIVPEAIANVVATGEGPLFSVLPEALAFGVLRDPGMHTRPILMLNSGSTQVRILSMTISGDPAFSLGILPGFPASLGAGESLLIDVQFDPAEIREYFGQVTITSDDPSMQQVDIEVTGGLADRVCEVSSNPTTIEFGGLAPGFIRTGSAVVTNIGTDTCTITAGAFRAPVDPAIRLLNTPWPTTLAPGEQFTVDVEFAPTQVIESKANLTMQTTDPVFPERHLTISGAGRGRVELFTDPMQVDFGAVEPMCSLRSRSITLYNTGTIGVDVTSMALTSSASNEFNPRFFPATPFHLAAGQDMQMMIGYQPSDLGVDLTALEIKVQYLTLPLVVPIRGEGALRPRNEDIFQQQRIDKVDVLFIIDDSCSMADDQAALAQNFRSFISSANVRQVDFQIGIARTTLHPNPGAFVGPIMTRSTQNLETEFSSQANVGISGSGFEQGLDGMASALVAAERGLGFNSGFLRPDATRAVIIISDEDDQSPGQPPFYFSELRARAPNGFSTIVVTGGPIGCARNGRSAFPAPKYSDFIRLTNGVELQICDDWAAILAQIGSVAFGLRTVFPLATNADEAEPIEVYINGVSQSQGWRYDASIGAVVFDTAPAAGATIRIVYTPVC